MNRWLFIAAILLPQCTGCLYYVYPKVSHVPELTVPNPDGSVHAFRVDIDQTERAPQPPLTQYTLSRIPIDSRGQVPSQLEVAPTTGILNPFGMTDAGQHERTHYTMFVRLYRPGSHTQEVKAWDKSRSLHWIAAADLPAQEKAIDDLLAVPSAPEHPAGGTWWDLKDDHTKKVTLGLQPGAASLDHRTTLQFAASEYLRLSYSPAASAPTMQAVRDRLRSKAQWLYSYADQRVAEAR